MWEINTRLMVQLNYRLLPNKKEVNKSKIGGETEDNASALYLAAFGD